MPTAERPKVAYPRAPGAPPKKGETMPAELPRLKKHWSWNEVEDPPLRKMAEAVRQRGIILTTGGSQSTPELRLKTPARSLPNVRIEVGRAEADWDAVAEAALYLEARFGLTRRGELLAVLE